MIPISSLIIKQCNIAVEENEYTERKTDAITYAIKAETIVGKIGAETLVAKVEFIIIM